MNKEPTLFGCPIVFHETEYTFKPKVEFGWLCPKCGSANRPKRRRCRCGHLASWTVGPVETKG